ncbi:E1-E2 ATPase-domain-containing protein [Aspergillus insuetus]
MPLSGGCTIHEPPDEHEPIDFGHSYNILKTALSPDQWDDPADFIVDDNRFAFSPGQLNKQLNPKSLPAFQALGGLSGLEKGLRTDVRQGLILDDTGLDFEDHKVRSEGGAPIAGTVVPAAAHRKRLLDSFRPSIFLKPEAGTNTPDASTAGEAHSDRERVFGQTRVPEKPERPRSFSDPAWMGFDDSIRRLLTIAATISLALDFYKPRAQLGWIEGVAVFVAILIVVPTGVVGDWHKEREFHKLTRRNGNRTVRAIRSGKTVEISAYDILVGEILHLEPGDIVPVDGIFIQGHGLKCDESSATGVSDLVRKMPAHEAYQAIEQRDTQLSKIDPFVVSGSKVLEGVGTYLVTSVGKHSTCGRIMLSLRRDYKMDRTPPQIRLDALARGSRLGVYAAVVLVIVLGTRLLVSVFSNDATKTAIDTLGDIGFGQGLQQLFILAVKVRFALKGLPEIFTVALFVAANAFTRLLKVCRALRGATTTNYGTTSKLGESEYGWNYGPQNSANRVEYMESAVHMRTRFVLPLRTDETEVDAIPDTGADENAISSACAHHLGIKVERDLSPKSNSPTFRLANGRVIESCGVASVASLTFAKGDNSWKRSKDPVLFRVFDALAVPMIIGRGFLEETETLTRHTDRLERVVVATSPASSSVPRVLHMNFAKERMLCCVNGVPVYANADTGAEMNLASPEWAARHAGTTIQKPGRGYEEVMLADGSRARILGQFDARFQLYDDESTTARKQSRAIISTRRFFILDGLTSDILLGPDLLFDIRAFKEQQKSFVILGAPTSSSFSEVNFVAWLSRPEKGLLGLFKGRRESNTSSTGVQSEADFRVRLDDEDAREQHLHKQAKTVIDQLPEPERSRRLDAENKRHRQYLGDRERREGQHYTTASVRRRMILPAC